MAAIKFNILLDKATSKSLERPDWKSIMRLCDMIRSLEYQPKSAIKTVAKKLTTANKHYALLILETIMKTCGPLVYLEFRKKKFYSALIEVLNISYEVSFRQRLLANVKKWDMGLQRQGGLKDTIKALRSDGLILPAVNEEEARLSVGIGPSLIDSIACFNCEVQFNFLKPKHHCRSCGKAFCYKCLSHSKILNYYQIEVRVCDSCYELEEPECSTPTAPSENLIETKIEAEVKGTSLLELYNGRDEGEALELAIAISKMDAGEDEGQISDSKDDMTCVICFDGVKQFMMADCNHLCLCSGCAKNFRPKRNQKDDRQATKCPVCRMSITKAPVRVYF